MEVTEIFGWEPRVQIPSLPPYPSLRSRFARDDRIGVRDDNDQWREMAMRIQAQLNFGGNCEEAFRFYEQHLGGKIIMMMNQSQAPGAPAGAGNAIIHARIDIGDSILTGNDVPSSVFQKIRSVYLLLSLDSPEEAERVHAALAEGGEVYMPMGETFFATRFSQLRDRFGVLWSVMHERPRG
jgi:PhnB protein